MNMTSDKADLNGDLSLRMLEFTCRINAEYRDIE